MARSANDGRSFGGERCYKTDYGQSFCANQRIINLIACVHAKRCSLSENNEGFFFFLLDLTPRFISEPLSTVQKSGGPVQLRCSAEPSTARLSWLFNGEPLDSKVGEVEIRSGSLTIVSLSPSTSGRYQCVANSSVGAVLSRPAMVSMGSKLIFLYIPCSLQVIQTSAGLCGLFIFDF